MSATITRLDTYRRNGDTLLTQWRAWQQAQGLSERTIKERGDTITRLVAASGRPAHQIEAADIIAFCSRTTLSPASRASYHASIRAFYKWALRVGIIDTDPTIHTPRPKRPKNLPRPVATVHISRIIDQANRKRTRAMVTLAAYAGLRVHEVAKFSGEDLDRASAILTVTGKGGKTAMIPAHDVIMKLAEEFPRYGYWFPAYSGAPHVTPHAVSKAIRDCMRRAGVDAKPHQLRHWYATELLEQGVDVRIVKDLMRHESLATTEIYTRVSLNQMRAGIVRLAPAATQLAA